MSALKTLPPGSTIGIIGGGQLGRMTALAAARLGYRTHVYTPERDSPAAQVTDRTTQAAYDDAVALAAFGAAVDVVTFEFENIPVEALSRLEQIVPVHPSPKVLRVTQDRLREKDFVTRLGLETTRYRGVTSFDMLGQTVAEIGRPAVLKSTRMGYDGKGQAKILPDTDLGQAWRQMGAQIGIVEAFVDFAFECSVIVARGQDGAMACYPAVENRHENHILSETLVPARMSAELLAEADRMGRAIAEGLDLVGLIAVELFATRDGRLLVNELAPRPHNSGHWSMDFSATSQFEQLVRAVCGLPLGDPDALAPCRMVNLIGDQALDWQRWLATPGARLHLYGKAEVRPGRKMGHVNLPQD